MRFLLDFGRYPFGARRSAPRPSRTGRTHKGMWEHFKGAVREHVPPPTVESGVITGNCLEVMTRLPRASVDLVVTDPPYMVNYKTRDGRPAYPNDDNDLWLRPSFEQMYALLKPDTFCLSFYGWWKVDSFMEAWKAAGFRPVGHFVFLKDYKSGRGYTDRYHENAYLLAKGQPKPRRVIPDVQEWVYAGNDLHPAQKPIQCLKPIIDAYSDRGALVFDPFCGSGSTLVAARDTERRYLGIELVPRFAEIAKRQVLNRW